MKRYFQPLLLFFGLILLGAIRNVRAQSVTQSEHIPTSNMGTAITYQGYLSDQVGAVTDTCDFQFTLYSSAEGDISIGTTQNKLDVPVTDGIFMIEVLDFGEGVFKGQALHMEITVRCPAGTGTYTPLSPRQPISPSPYALAIPGLYSTAGSEAPNLVGGHYDNMISEGVFGGTIGGGGANSGKNYVYDHVGTVSGGANNQAGSNDDDYWNGDGAAIGGGWNNTASGAISTVSGGADNAAGDFATTVGGGWENQVLGASSVIAGGDKNAIYGSSSAIAGGTHNSILSNWASNISGGYTNTVNADAAHIGGGGQNTVTGWGGVVSGGQENSAEDWAATVGGGYQNHAIAPATTIGGGSENTASSDDATVAGGTGNTAEGNAATVVGGQFNTASGTAATVLGGVSNAAQGDYSLAAGHEAYALDLGSFVWSDSTGSFETTANNQFLINATGGVGIGTNETSKAALAVTTQNSNAVYLDGIGTEPLWLTYLGFNAYWNKTHKEWFLPSDTVHNAGALITSSWINGDLNFHTFDSSQDGSLTQGVDLNNRMTIDGETGQVGINNPNPAFQLDVNGNINFTGDLYQNGVLYSTNGGTSKWSGTSDIYYTGGNVGIGEMWPESDLHIRSSTPFIQYEDSDGGNEWITGLFSNETHQYYILYEETTDNNWEGRMWVRNDGVTGVNVLQILGGSDFAEPFDIYGAENVLPGMVVAIDPEHPGQLRRSETAYDHMVAGCVSGANGISPGLIMGQEGTEADGEFPVALSGRVYCYADASHGVIQPGDLLTTSDTPGHLMVVKDHSRAQGAIVGKAMSSLADGLGLVLILVTLQ